MLDVLASVEYLRRLGQGPSNVRNHLEPTLTRERSHIESIPIANFEDRPKRRPTQLAGPDEVLPGDVGETWRMFVLVCDQYRDF